MGDHIKEFVLAALPWIIMGIALAVCVVNMTKKKKGKTYFEEGLVLGMSVGVVIWLVFKVNYGLSLGMLVGMAVGSMRKKK